MTAAELKFTRLLMRLGPVAMSRLLGITYRHYQRLERGAPIQVQTAFLVALARREHERLL